VDGSPLPKERNKMKKLSKKQEETIERMKQVRQEDNVNLRKKIEEKLIWIDEQIKLGEKQITITEQKILRLNGAEIILKELIAKQEIKEEQK
jgi:hypothetical protein